MNLDVLLLKLFLQDSSVFLKYGKYVNTKTNNLFSKLYHTVRKLKEDGNDSHTVEEFVAKFHTLYPVVSSGELEVLESVTPQIMAADASAGVEEVLKGIKSRHIAEALAVTAVEVSTGAKSFDHLLEGARQVLEGADDDYTEEDEDDFVSDNIVEIKDRFAAEPPFQFRLKALNAVLGGLRRRTLGFLFARPETGKTQLIASEASYLATQVDTCILWVNNEEDGTTLVTRLYQAALKRDSQALFADAEKARDEYAEVIQGKIKIYDKPTATIGDIENVVKRLQPAIVFIDQLDKVKGVDAERNDLKLKSLYQWARELSKRYNCAVVGICQAGGTAEGKKWLDMNDVDSSHTAKQGEADWICGMGVSDRVGDEDKRFLAFPKNKLPATDLMRPEMRHGKIAIRSIPEIQIYEDVINV